MSFDFFFPVCVPAPLIFSPDSYIVKWDAVNDFVPSSHYAGSRVLHSLSHENY